MRARGVVSRKMKGSALPPAGNRRPKGIGAAVPFIDRLSEQVPCPGRMAEGILQAPPEVAGPGQQSDPFRSMDPKVGGQG